MKVFVTGGNGFIGSVVVRELIARGHDVVCLLRVASRTERIDGLALGRALGDVSDLESIRAAMAGCDCTVHLAAPSSWDGDDAAAVRRVIEGGTYNVLRAAGELADHRVVFVSSTAAVNGANVPRLFDERSEFTLLDPVLRYAHAKHRAEIQAHESFRSGVPVVIVNPAEVYGPGDTGLVTAGNLIDFATSNPVLVCRGGTSIVHVADVAVGIVAALERGRPGERYILGGENLTIRQLAELCLELLGKRARIVMVPNRMARALAGASVRLHLPMPFNPHVVPYATRYWFVDNGKACRELGLTFRGARETIGSTLAWLRSVARIPG
ncbi:MAG TPA: NAD-dependent epimerase/dehydratase family protein [Gemmatimonadaceae bacterium]